MIGLVVRDPAVWTYDLANAGILQATGDRDGLDQELILALGIRSRVLLHSLKQHYREDLARRNSSVLGYQLTLDFDSLARLDVAGVRSHTVTGIWSDNKSRV